MDSPLDAEIATVLEGSDKPLRPGVPPDVDTLIDIAGHQHPGLCSHERRTGIVLCNRNVLGFVNNQQSK